MSSVVNRAEWAHVVAVTNENGANVGGSRGQRWPSGARERERLLDVLFFELGVFAEEIRSRRVRGEGVEDAPHRDAQIANAGLTTEPRRVRSDAVEDHRRERSIRDAEEWFAVVTWWHRRHWDRPHAFFNGAAATRGRMTTTNRSRAYFAARRMSMFMHGEVLKKGPCNCRSSGYVGEGVACPGTRSILSVSTCAWSRPCDSPNDRLPEPRTVILRRAVLATARALGSLSSGQRYELGHRLSKRRQYHSSARGRGGNEVSAPSPADALRNSVTRVRRRRAPDAANATANVGASSGQRWRSLLSAREIK
jgi:hypothetical protein